MYTWILELSSPETREHALIELSKKREVLPDLAPMLWYSFGTLSALLQEIVMIYPVINPPSLTVKELHTITTCIHGGSIEFTYIHRTKGIICFVGFRQIAGVVYFLSLLSFKHDMLFL